MRTRKNQHKFLHGAAFLITGGMSAPVSAGMMGVKASRNRKADDEMERLIAASGGGTAPAAGSKNAKWDELLAAFETGDATWDDLTTMQKLSMPLAYQVKCKAAQRRLIKGGGNAA